MTNCFFCGSHIETMQNEDYFKDKPHLKMDRYFIDKQDNKPMCKLCGVHYIQRQYVDSVPEGVDPDDDGLLRFIESGRFEKVLL